MKKKLIALTVATALTATAISLAGCGGSTTKPETPPSPPPAVAMTEQEWKDAWQATYDLTNYTTDSEWIIAYLNNDYPTYTQATKLTVDLDMLRYYEDRSEIGVSNGDVVHYTNGYFAYYTENNTLYSAEKHNDWTITSTTSEEETINRAFAHINLFALINDTNPLTAYYFENEYSNFTYNNKNGIYSGTIRGIGDDDEEKELSVTVKFNEGKLSEFKFIFEDDFGLMTYSLKVYNVGTTIPISDKDLAEIKAAINVQN